MNNIDKIITKYTLEPKAYRYRNKAIILDTDKGKFVFKKRKRNDKKEIYDYLLSRNFSFFLYPENNFDDEYEIYAYLDEFGGLKEEKASHLVSILAELQNRTTSYTQYTLDEIKEIYETKSNMINYLFEYYNDLEEVFSTHIYPAPFEALLLNNVSKIYNTLSYSKNLVEKWYNKILTNKKKRLVFLHNHLTLNHFIDGKEAKLINFDYAKYGSPIIDFVNFYKTHYLEMDMYSLFMLYQRKYRYTEEELLLFFIEIIIPDKVTITNDVYQNTLDIYHLITYIDITREFILKQEQKQQKEN